MIHRLTSLESGKILIFILFVFLNLLIAILLTSCRIGRNITFDDNKRVSIEAAYKPKLEQLYLEATISVNFKSESQIIFSKIYLSSLDSILMIINGPLSIPIGKLYSNQEYFIFYSVFLNEVFEGNPSGEALMDAIKIPFNFHDLMHILRCEPLLNPGEYSVEKTDTSKNNILFKSINSEFIDYAYYSLANKALIQYQRKSNDGKIIFNIVYDDFTENGINVPTKANIRFSAIEGNINLTYTKVIINEKDDTTYSFKVPEGLKRNKY